ncbi:MAG: hypothetical protein ACREQ9_08645 [Candidatus Binatia bacterium]
MKPRPGGAALMSAIRIPLRARLLASGIRTYLRSRRRGIPQHTGGTDSARYSYGVWLRHVRLAAAAGLARPPARIAELGPGDSLGIGLAGLVSGSEQYVGLDIVPYARNVRNLEILDELVELFRRREAIPGPSEFPT